MISMRRGSIQLMRQEVWGYCTLVPDSTRTVKYSMEGYICGSGATLVEAGSRMCWYMLIVL